MDADNVDIIDIDIVIVASHKSASHDDSSHIKTIMTYNAQRVSTTHLNEQIIMMECDEMRCEIMNKMKKRLVAICSQKV